MTFDPSAVHLAGWRRDLPDHRDLHFQAFTPPAALPPKADVLQWLPRVEDQSRIGSCVANSSTSAVETLARKAGRRQPELSRLFVYYVTRIADGTPPTEDSGCVIRTAMRMLATVGCCTEDIFPYSPDRYMVEPPAVAYVEAGQHKITAYRRCPTLAEIRGSINEGYPVVGGFSVPESMMTAEVARTGVVPFPSASDAMVGGHAVLFVGYDDAANLLRFRNSWGQHWGASGDGFLDYRFVTEGLADDFWCATDAEYYALRQPDPVDEAAA